MNILSICLSSSYILSDICNDRTRVSIILKDSRQRGYAAICPYNTSVTIFIPVYKAGGKLMIRLVSEKVLLLNVARRRE